MSLFDDLSAKLKSSDALKNIGSDIYDYFGKRVVQPLVKIGEPQTQPGAPAPAQPSAPLTAGAAAASAAQGALKYIPWFAAVAIAAIIFKKRKG